MGIKFVTSNYKQNANNYFENMMGEVANIQAGNIPYAQLFILRQEIPYYNEQGEQTKTEIVKDGDIQKYLNLVFDNPQAHRPFAMAIKIIDIEEQTATVSNTNLKKYFTEEVANLLESKLSVKNFFKEIKNQKNFYTSQKNG